MQKKNLRNADIKQIYKKELKIKKSITFEEDLFIFIYKLVRF